MEPMDDDEIVMLEGERWAINLQDVGEEDGDAYVWVPTKASWQDLNYHS